METLIKMIKMKKSNEYLQFKIFNIIWKNLPKNDKKFLFFFLFLSDQSDDLVSIKSNEDSMCDRVEDLLSITGKKSLPVLIVSQRKDNFIEKVSSSYRLDFLLFLLFLFIYPMPLHLLVK